MGKFHYIKTTKKAAFAGAVLFLLTGTLLPSGISGLTAASGISTTAQAASVPAFSTKRTSLYENGSSAGVYTYTVKNLKKGYKVKWSLSGKGASYLTLKHTTTKASGTKSSNKITVDTLGSRSAGNQKATLTAHVYNKDGKLVHKVVDNFTLKVNSTYLRIKTNKITDSLDALPANKAYDFDCSISPANATSNLYWKVTSENGSDYSSQITPDGVWRPTADGKYSIQAYTKNSASGSNISSAQINVTVGSTLIEARQNGADSIIAAFTGNMKDKVVLSDFTINYIAANTSSAAFSYNSPVSLKELILSEDGKSVIVKTSTNLMDKAVYQISYKGQIISTFTASIGQPVSGVILTTEIPANTYCDIKYALYDSNGMDVTSVYRYLVTFSGVVPNGYISTSGNLYMDALDQYASITMTCQNGMETFMENANVLCALEGSSGIRTVITSSTDNPVFENSNTSSAASFYLGDTAYFHFQIYDKNGNPITVSNPYYTSLDTSIFTISSNGQLTGKKAGTAMVSVYGTVDYKQVHYKTAVTVLPRRTPSYLALSETGITMSNALEDDYKTELTLSATDQYHNPVGLATASVTIREASGKAVLASYDRTTGRITIAANGAAPGIYDYTVNLLLGASRLSTSFQVTVQSVPASGLNTYLPELNTAILDTSTVTSGSRPLDARIRLAHYVNGIFAGYVPIQSAAVKNSQGWYNDDLTAAPTAKAQRIYPQDNQIILTAAYWDGGFLKKANEGVYTLNLKYYEDKNGENDELKSTEMVFVVK